MEWVQVRAIYLKGEDETSGPPHRFSLASAAFLYFIIFKIF